MIHLIVGRQGSGKTLFLVRMAYEHYLKEQNVYSNVHLTYKSKEPLKHKNVDNTKLEPEQFYKKYGYYFLDYQDIIDCNLHNGIVILDEVHQLLPARASLSKINRIVCDSFLSMVRKQGLTIYGSTQTVRKVDVRFREETDFLYVCTKYAFLNNKWTEVMHNQNLPKTVKIMIKIEVQEQYSGNWVTVSFMGNEFFKFFSTDQIIRIRGLTI